MPSMKTFITLVIVVALVLGVASPLEGAVQDFINTDAELQAQQIASAINFLRAAPDGTEAKISLPDTKCSLEIKNTYISYAVEKFGRPPKTVVEDLIQNNVEISPMEKECPDVFFLKKEKGRVVTSNG